METNDVVKAMAALAQASRLEIFRALVVAGTEGMTPSALSDALGVAANTLSFHLKELTNAGLVAQERAGRHLIYRAQFERMNALMAQAHQPAPAAAPPAAATDSDTDDLLKSLGM